LKCDGTCTETRFFLTALEMWWHMRRNQILSHCVWNVMAHAQKSYFVLLLLKCDGTCAETRFCLTAFEMWWHMQRNQILSYCFLNVMAHAQKPDFFLLFLKCDGTCTETRFFLAALEMWWHMRRNQILSHCFWNVMAHAQKSDFVLLVLKCDGTCAETRFCLTSFEMWWCTRRNQITSFWRNGRVHLNQRCRQLSRLLAADVCASAIVMLDTPCFEVVWRVLDTHSIRQFSLHSPPRTSPCSTTFQLESTSKENAKRGWRLTQNNLFSHVIENGLFLQPARSWSLRK